MISYAVKVDDAPTEFSYFTELELSKRLREAFGKAKLLVGFNIKFDLHWARRLGVLPPEGVRVWDCQIAEFLIRGQQGSYPSLNEALSRFNLGEKDDKIAEYWDLGINTDQIPVDELKFYNVLDVDLTYKLYLRQLEYMQEHHPKLVRLCYVMGLDLLVLQDMEWNGVKLDVEQCKTKAEQTAKELEEITAELYNYTPTRLLNFDSGHHLSCFLYGGAFEIKVVDRVEKQVYKSGQKKGIEYERTYWRTELVECEAQFVPIKGSQTKLKSKAGEKEYSIYATGEDVLKQLRKPTHRHRRIIELLLRRAEQEKLLSTYYGALPKLLTDMEWEDNLLHGQYNQVVARTGRLSSSNPNQQNFSVEVDQLLITRFT